MSSELTTPKPCVLRRSYTFLPGQSLKEHEEMSARLDAENADIGLGTALYPPPAPVKAKRAYRIKIKQEYDEAGLDDEAWEAHVREQEAFPSSSSQICQEPKKKRKRKAAAPRPKKLTAVKKTMNGNIFYEISLPDGSVVLTSVLAFSS